MIIRTERYLQTEGSDATNPSEEANHTPTGSLPEQRKKWMLEEPDASRIAAELECSPTIDTLIQDFRNDKAIGVSDVPFTRNTK